MALGARWSDPISVRQRPRGPTLPVAPLRPFAPTEKLTAGLDGEVGGPLGLVLTILAGIPLEQRAAWIARRLPRTWALLGCSARWLDVSDLGD